MKNKKKLFGIIVLITASFLMGSFFNQSEAKLKVIKAGVDEKGNQVCINKSQVYLFKKNQAENKILFFIFMTLKVKMPWLLNHFPIWKAWISIGRFSFVTGRLFDLPSMSFFS